MYKKGHKRELSSDIKEKIKNKVERLEENYLSDYASTNEDAIRRHQRKKPDIRTKYSRDADRILHSYAYSRYIDKTQVFFLVDNDHITHRVLHVHMVSKIARTIGRALSLNEDLIEAIAIGHDIGHIPYGHEGEEILSEICEERGIGRFVHNVQAVQWVDTLEDKNLTLQVLDGILCHNGEEEVQRLTPQQSKDWACFDREFQEIKEGKQTYAPMTLEGCVVRFADIISYVGRDLQDAIEVNLLEDFSVMPQFSQETLGTSNAEIINTLIIDVIENSSGQDYIAYSGEVHQALKTLKEFNYEHIYKNPKVMRAREKMERVFKILFEHYLNDLEEKNQDSKIYTDFLDYDWMNEKYIEQASKYELVRDFIAGMTDHYFQSTFSEITLPQQITSF